MKTLVTNTKEKRKHPLFIVLTKLMTQYINGMSKALYPDTDTPSEKNDKNRIFYK